MGKQHSIGKSAPGAGLGRVGIIANPVAQSGAAAAVAEVFAGVLCDYVDGSACHLLLTEHQGHAVDMVSKSHGEYDTLVVIGGDGIVHEVANGLMRVPGDARPRLAVVPVGSGNDYALTLGMSPVPEKALRQILACNTRTFDVGCVNGRYFVETLSFGIDAAIALDTMERRKRTGRHGTILYMESGFNQIFRHLDSNSYAAQLEGAPTSGASLNIEGDSYTFAVQIGKTYGGHFKVCPDASPEDGLFDICIAHAPMSPLKAIGVFLLAKGGHHTGFKMIEIHKASSLTVQFSKPPAAQTDGERIEGTHFHIDMLPRALEVIVGDFKG